MKRLTLMVAMLVFVLAGTAFAAETAPAAQVPQGVNDKAPAVEKKKRPKFEECDTNKDGFLSKEEFAACHPRKAAKFEEMDANKDGKLAKEEIQAWREAHKKDGKGKKPRKNGDR